MKKTIEQLKNMKNSLVKNIALAKRMGTSKRKSKSTISKQEFAKLKTYGKKKKASALSNCAQIRLIQKTPLLNRMLLKQNRIQER